MLRWLLGKIPAQGRDDKLLFRRDNGPGLTVAAKPLADPRIQSLPLPPKLCYQLQQAKIGQLIPLVKTGDRVRKWQPIAQGLGPNRFTISAASSGYVTAIKASPVISAAPKQVLSMHIATDGQDEAYPLSPPTADQSLAAVLAKAGIIGLGGAGFPSLRKWNNASKASQTCHTLIVNAVECEPYVQRDLGLLTSHGESIMAELGQLKRRLGLERLILALKTTQTSELMQLQALASQQQVEIVSVADKYPNGAERRLVELVTGQTIPKGGLPLDLGILTQNIATVSAIAKAWQTGEPMTSRVVTLAGNGIKRPGNYLVPLGTPVEFCLEQVGFEPARTAQLSEGGHIMSTAIVDPKAPITASSNCILALDTLETATSLDVAEQACIRCGACAEVCPEYLLPQQLHWFSRNQDSEKLQHYNLERCIECACCDAVCPSHIPLSANFAKAKQLLGQEQMANKQALAAKERYNAREVRLESREQALQARRATKKREVTAGNKALAAGKSAASNASNKKRAILEAVQRAKAKQRANGHHDHPLF